MQTNKNKMKEIDSQMEMLNSVYRNTEKQYKNLIEKLKLEITKMPSDKVGVFNEGINKIEKSMREIEFPSEKSMNGEIDIDSINNKIIAKLEEVQNQFIKIKEECLS